MKRIAARYWPIALMATVLLSGGIALRHSWPDSEKSQTIVAAASFTTTILLLCITWMYVLTNQDTLVLLRRQWDESRRVCLNFGLTVEQDQPVIWIANLGLAHFMVSGVRLRTPAGQLEEFEDHVVVQPGKIEKLCIPERVFSGAHVTGDLDISLHYEGPGVANEKSEMTPAQGYNLLIVQGAVKKVRSGFHDLRPVKCPKCKKSDQIFMRAEGLKSEEDAFERQRVMEGQLEASCPSHQSQWIFQEHSSK